ncbi:MAG: hypothetical protein N2C14_33360, partial [Planctomycetales bacterium]
MDGEPMVIYEAASSAEAFELRRRLTEAGIRAELTREPPDGFEGGPVRGAVAVPASEERAADKVIQTFGSVRGPDEDDSSGSDHDSSVGEQDEGTEEDDVSWASEVW